MSGFNSRGYVVEKNNEMIAMCLGRIDYYYNNLNPFCIDEFNVTPALQGVGICKNSLIFITNVMKDEQINSCFLITGGEQASTFYNTKWICNLQ